MAVKRQIVWGAASLAALYVGVASALGLGELELDSALNQPLDATIFLQGGENLEPSDIRVSLADAAAFRSAGLDRPHFLTELRFTPTLENNRLVVRVQSPGPVREPYLNFLVELRRPNGRLLREYTLLLDPPMYQPPVVSQPRSYPAPVAKPINEGRSTETAVRQAPAETRKTHELPDLAPASGAQQYRTSAGDSLWGIASRARPNQSVSIEDTMLAIRALNPNAFINGDPNRLRVGQLLTLPTAEQLGASGSVAGAGEETQAARSEQANPAPLIPARPASASSAAGSDQQEAGVGAARDDGSATKVAAQAPTARLRIEEELRSEQSSADAAVLVDRLRSLEARFNVMLDELDARDRQIASLQAELEILRQAQQAESARVDADPVGAAGPTLSEADAANGPATATGSEDPQAGAVDAELLPAVAESADPAAQSEPAMPADDAQEHSLISRWWPALVGLLAVLLGLLFFARKRADDDDDTEPKERVVPAQTARVAPQAAAPLAAAVAADGDSARPASVRAAPKPVDPLDGVELYITYGRFAEARGMLDKAIAEQPDRLDLRYKQLRVLAELGDARAFSGQEQQVLEKGGDAGRIEQIKARFPALFASKDADLVEQVDRVEPLLNEDETAQEPDLASQERAQEITATQLNLNDFTLDPDWDLIEGLTPAKPRKSADDAASAAADEPFESSLHEFPEIEELDDEHHEHFPGIRRDGTPRSNNR